FVLKPTHPSAVGSIDGSSRLRAGPLTAGRPNRLYIRSTNRLVAIVIASSWETSTCVPRPVRRAPLTAASAAGAPYAPVAHSATRPPACSGRCEGRPRKPSEPHAACTVNSVAGRSSHGPPRPKGESESTTIDG